MNTKKALLNKIVELASETLDVREQDIVTNINIQELGFESVSLVSFVEKVSAGLNEEIHPGIFFEHSTLSEFADYLIENKADVIEKYISTNNADESATVSKTAMNDQSSTKNEDDLWSLFSGESDSKNNTDSEAENYNFAQEELSKINTKAIPDNVPVIVGGGIGGMLISRQLSKSKIPHIVIGSSQLGDSPKLGESMTEACTIEFTREFKDYSQYFFPKDVTPFFMGDIVAGLRFDFFGTFSSLFLDKDVPQTFIHVDRIGFDKALYNEVIQNEECFWIEELVDDIEYSESNDSIERIHLKSGQSIKPSFAWDCTNHIRLFGRKLNVPYNNFDEQRQVIYTHYVQKDNQSLCHHEDLPWMHATTLLRADEKHDKLNGVSWFIPLGSYISVGISMDPSDVGDKNPEEIITALTKAYQSRGIDYSKHFARRKEVVSIPSQHFMYDRFCGSNWAMVGGSAASAWFTSGSNLSTVVCMASMADKIIKEPALYGEHYSRHVRGFARTQLVYDTLLKSDLGALDATKFLASIVEQARKRISSYYMFRNGVDSATAVTAKELWEEEAIIDKQYFDFLKQIATHASPENRKDQASEIFANLKKLRTESKSVTMPYLRNSTSRREKAELFI